MLASMISKESPMITYLVALHLASEAALLPAMPPRQARGSINVVGPVFLAGFAIVYSGIVPSVLNEKVRDI